MVKSEVHPNKSFRLKVLKDWRRNKPIYFLAIFGVVYFIIFHYLPMFGILMAFQRFKPNKGILEVSGLDFNTS